MRSFALAALLTTAAVAAPADLQTRQYSCVQGAHVVALGGQGTTDGDLGYLATLVGNITSSIPNSDMFQIGYAPGALGPQDIPVAIPQLQQHIQQYAADCPNTKMILASYSVGAAVTMDVLCGSAQTGEGALSDDYRKNIVANVVYGDLTYLPNKKYDVGTCNINAGLVPRQKPGECFPYGRKTHSYCDLGDVNCCGGDDPTVHFSYPEKYDFIASAWAKQRFENHN